MQHSWSIAAGEWAPTGPESAGNASLLEFACDVSSRSPPSAATVTARRFLLGLVAFLCGLLTLYLASADVHYTDRNCGTALFGSDPNKLSVSTGDIEADEYTEQALIDNCDHLILGRRFLTLVPAAIAAACTYQGRRLRDRIPRTGTTIFGTQHR